MIEILRYLTDRRDGKAYVAENPAERQKAVSLRQDSRLQDAIQELMIPGVRKPSPNTNRHGSWKGLIWLGFPYRSLTRSPLDHRQGVERGLPKSINRQLNKLSMEARARPRRGDSRDERARKAEPS